MSRVVRALFAVALAGLLLVWALLWFARVSPTGSALLTRIETALGLAREGSGLVLPAGTEIGGPFQLVDPSGRTLSEADFRGRWMLVYFGYTFCPDLCPTELQTMAAALDRLGAAAAGVAPLFITIDPERDTPDVLAKYVKLFDPRIVGLTGIPSAIATAARNFRVYYAKVPGKNGAPYLMDHSSLIYLMDPQGRLAALFDQATTARDLADAIRSHMARPG